jgi:hypothetical protein
MRINLTLASQGLPWLTCLEKLLLYDNSVIVYSGIIYALQYNVGFKRPLILLSTRGHRCINTCECGVPIRGEG